MPGLAQSLQAFDLGQLRSIAETWGLSLRASDSQEATKQLSELIIAKADDIEALPKDQKEALNDLIAAGGKLPWLQFTRQFGELREMGPARFEKEQPQRNPISTTETLWYRGLIGRGFFDGEQGLVEHAYLPDELLALLPSEKVTETLGRMSRPEERAFMIPASDKIVDAACTLLAGLRIGMSDEEIAGAEPAKISISFLRTLLQTGKLLDAKGVPIPKPTRAFLEADRGKALAILVSSWLQSTQLNELRLMPGIVAEGNWENAPKQARKQVLSFARHAPAGQWWSIPGLISDVKRSQPDFQRSGGDYDSWYMREADSGNFLRGFENWEKVEGALIAFMLCGPLHWLGLVDLAAPSESKPPLAFRWTAWAPALLNGKPPKGFKDESAKFKIDSRGIVSVPRHASRATRYQMARFTQWLPQKGDAHQYQVTAKAMQRAESQGLKAAQLLALLKANGGNELPPHLNQALKRWEQNGVQASIGGMLVLRVQSAAALKALRASRAARYLGEPLGPNAIEVKAGAATQVEQALAELGYLAEFSEEI